MTKIVLFALKDICKTIKERIDHTFEREQGRIVMKIWREESKREKIYNYITIKK